MLNVVERDRMAEVMMQTLNANKMCVHRSSGTILSEIWPNSYSDGV